MIKYLIPVLTILVTPYQLWAAPQSSYPTKTTPVAGDKFLVVDSQDSWRTKNILFSSFNKREIGWVLYNSSTATTIADGLQAAVIPATMTGMNLVDLTCTVANLNSATSGNTTVVVRRLRGATAVDMTSTGVTVAYNGYTASDEVVNTSNDDIVTGDALYLDVNTITSPAHKGLSCTAVFQLP